jgi:hypothetical protein
MGVATEDKKEKRREGRKEGRRRNTAEGPETAEYAACVHD